MILSVSGITKTFGTRRVLDNVSFELQSGEIFGFAGPNGAGKTTCIKIILGLLSAESGEVYINGKSVKNDHDEALKSVGAIIESPDLYGDLTGRENLMQFARIYGIGADKVIEAAETVGLTARIDSKVKTYSLGMRQRLGVAQALIHSPNLLVLDEPTNGLDPDAIVELRDILKRVAASGAAVLVSSHLLSELEHICNSFCVIEQGRIVARKAYGELGEAQGSGESDSFIYSFLTDDNGAASALAESLGYKFTLGTEFTVGLTDEQAADFASELISSGRRLYGMSKKRKTLEDTYFEFTADSKNGGSFR